MIVLDPESKIELARSLSVDMNMYLEEHDVSTILRTYNKIVYNVIKEAEEKDEVDFGSLKDRISWFLGKLIQNKQTLENWQTTELWKKLFKDVTITVKEDGSIDLTIKGSQVSGTTKAFMLAYITYTYLLSSSFASDDRTKEIGGAIINNFSKVLVAEAAKRADLSEYSVTGDLLRQIYEDVHNEYPLANLLACSNLIILLDQKFGTVHKELLLIAVNIVKTMLANIAGYIFTYLIKFGELFDINTKILALDIKYQFKALGFTSSTIEKTVKKEEKQEKEVVNKEENKGAKEEVKDNTIT